MHQQTLNISIAEMKFIHNKLYKKDVPPNFNFEAFLELLTVQYGKNTLNVRSLIKGFDFAEYLDDPKKCMEKARLAS